MLLQREPGGKGEAEEGGFRLRKREVGGEVLGRAEGGVTGSPTGGREHKKKEQISL